MRFSPGGHTVNAKAETGIRVPDSQTRIYSSISKEKERKGRESLSLFSENSSGCFQPGGHEGFVARLHTLISVSLGSRGLGEKFHGRVPWPGGESPGLCLSPAPLIPLAEEPLDSSTSCPARHLLPRMV